MSSSPASPEAASASSPVCSTATTPVLAAPWTPISTSRESPTSTTQTSPLLTSLPPPFSSLPPPVLTATITALSLGSQCSLISPILIDILPTPRSQALNSPLISLPIEIQLFIIRYLQDVPISLLALRETNSYWSSVISEPLQLIRWRKIALGSRAQEFALAEQCLTSAHESDRLHHSLFSGAKLPCYGCLEIKGKSCFPRDVREGNLKIGAADCRARRCNVCGGSSHQGAKEYMRYLDSKEYLVEYRKKVAAEYGSYVATQI